MSRWDSEPLPERQWAIRDRVPLNQAGLLSGEGGVGKSIVELTKDVAHVAGKDWLGTLPEQGPAFYVGAEDEENEIHIRLALIAKHYGVTFKELIEGGLRAKSLLGEDAVLCVTTRSGKVEVTKLYHELYEEAGDVKPKNISIDILSRAFAGNEIDRVQVYAFAMHMQALAMVANGSVTVLSHPSLAGIASGSGISGSTAWHGAFRFRQYLRGVKPDAGEQPDGDVRELQFKKNQYGPTGETIIVRYQNGLFLPERGVSSLNKLARETVIDEAFLNGLQTLTQQGRDAMAGYTSLDFGPSLIANLPEVKSQGIRKADLRQSMERLLSANKIHIGKTDDAPSKAETGSTSVQRKCRPRPRGEDGRGKVESSSNFPSFHLSRPRSKKAGSLQPVGRQLEGRWQQDCRQRQNVEMHANARRAKFEWPMAARTVRKCSWQGSRHQKSIFGKVRQRCRCHLGSTRGISS